MKFRETVIFDKVSLNEGNAYDKTSGIFTAPLNGIYSFTWTTATRGGKLITKMFTDGSGRNGIEVTTSHVNIKMKKGDKAWIRAYRHWGYLALGGDWCSFSGVKL